MAIVKNTGLLAVFLPSVGTHIPAGGSLDVADDVARGLSGPDLQVTFGSPTVTSQEETVEVPEGYHVEVVSDADLRAAAAKIAQEGV